MKLKRLPAVITSLALLISPARSADTKTEALKAGGAATAGAAVGYGAVAAAGLTAVGAAGSGAGIGAAAGPVGAAVGALTGLAVYGIYRVFKD
jgi:hypothetical protein